MSRWHYRAWFPSFFGRLLIRHSNKGGQMEEFEFGVEQPAEFYDQTFNNADHWKKHYTRSRYYPVWTVIADRVRKLGVKRILDIGCGPGQVACMFRDRKIEDYKGLDFSPARIKMARKVCPEFEFRIADVFEDDLLENYDYDCVVILEFLEHVERELDVLSRIRSGTAVIATVPNFPAQGHVRHFQSIDEVHARYGEVLSGLDVMTILSNPNGSTFYLMQGTRV